MSLRIEDYGVIGDCHTAALVGRNGSIDWLCLPRFDSGACFASLLGEPENGRWLLCPQADRVTVTRRYRRDSLVLETDFELPAGDVVRIVDFMPIRGKVADVIRIVEGVKGKVPMRMDLRLRFDYGSITPWLRKSGEQYSAIAGPDKVTLHSPVRIHRNQSNLDGEFHISQGERIAFNMTWCPSHEEAPGPLDAIRALHETEHWWRNWAESCKYRGRWRDMVVRSAITLKALTYKPTGGLVAAITTSLPESIGGVRNWDYRYCWVRDATFTLMALINCGYVEEARAWRDWLLRATAGHPAELQMLYGVGGERRLSEFELKYLRGYEKSTPVRIGNAASQQFQLDVFGEVADAAHQWLEMRGPNHSEFGWALMDSMVRFLETAWKEPDEGIWEVRGPRRHFTHSKMMAWVAMDRAISIAKRINVDAPVDRWEKIRTEIHEEVCEKAFDKEINSFVQFYGSKLLDSAVLRMPLVGFLAIDDPRVKGTIKAIESRLLKRGFIQRYEDSPKVDGLPEGEGEFLMCTLWYADVLHMSGRIEDARDVFERVTGISNDLGLLSEMYDVDASRLVGNFPQAFSHVGIINTALRLSGEGVVPEDLAPVD